MRQKSNLLENTRHGTPEFPFQYYHCSIPESFTTLPVHWHEELELTYVLEGGSTYQIDLNPYQVHAGDIILIPPGILHGITDEEYSYMVTDSFVFRTDMLDAMRSDTCTAYLNPVTQHTVHFPMVLPATEPYTEKIHTIILQLLEVCREKPWGYELEIKSLLYHLFFTLYQYVPYQKQQEDNSEITDKLKLVLQYIQENYREPVPVSELANLCGFSEYHFMRFFKKHMNMTCVEYLNQYRMDMASRQLSSTDLPVTTIALENGFNNISYFNRVFKKQFGNTPKEFRKSTGIQNKIP